MPVYEYVCLECDHTFEAKNTVTDREKSKCPQCGKLADKIMSMSVNIDKLSLPTRKHKLLF